MVPYSLQYQFQSLKNPVVKLQGTALRHKETFQLFLQAAALQLQVHCYLVIVKCSFGKIYQRLKSWSYYYISPVSTLLIPFNFLYTTIEYGKKRSFQYRYLQLHKWLGYSVQLDGCLCLPCCLFGSDAENAKNFVQKPVSNWTTFNKKVRIHSTSSTHTKCALVMTAFIDTHSGVQPTIDTSLSKHRQELYRLNCKSYTVLTVRVIPS